MSKDDGNGEENKLKMWSLIASQADQINTKADQIDAQAREIERITGFENQIQSLAESMRQLQPNQGLDPSRELVWVFVEENDLDANKRGCCKN